MKNAGKLKFSWTIFNFQILPLQPNCLLFNRTPKKMPVDIYCNGCDAPDQFVRVQNGDIVRVHVDMLLIKGEQLLLMTNSPAKSMKCVRSTFRPIEPTTSKTNRDNTFEIELTMAGAFQYYLILRSNDSSQEQIGNQGTFNVDPVLSIKRKTLPLDALIAQTCLAKCLGPLDNWAHHFRIASKMGFNCVHLTPVSMLGLSGSSYSITNQTVISEKIVPKPDERQRAKDLRDFAAWARDELGVLTMGDVVLNHTAADSVWLAKVGRDTQIYLQDEERARERERCDVM
jgi:hypothetical protein